ncbi:unnamed protein product [Symbiodinium natans]|uniref:EF-hand domain-containing protein n=1 Tax=Symbiodinium natans TaxID=878477 RepID=A0A812T232_9DINO|nr:unnamed protein product [Symbiodinium natans]
MPNFSDRDLNDLLRVIDTNGSLGRSNGVVEYEEFCHWLVKENPLDFSSSTFSAYVSQLMREAGQAKDKASMIVDEIQVRDDGVYFRLQPGAHKHAESHIKIDFWHSWFGSIDCLWNLSKREKSMPRSRSSGELRLGETRLELSTSQPRHYDPECSRPSSQ